VHDSAPELALKFHALVEVIDAATHEDCHRFDRLGHAEGLEQNPLGVIELLVQFFGSDKIAMATMGVKEVTPAEEPELHAIVERLCVQANLPKPKVAVIETSMPNACAMGKSKKATTVCATRSATPGTPRTRTPPFFGI